MWSIGDTGITVWIKEIGIVGGSIKIAIPANLVLNLHMLSLGVSMQGSHIS